VSTAVQDPALSGAADAKVQDAHDATEPLAPLFAAGAADDFRSRWNGVQVGFVDNPKDAVRKADELVTEVMKSLTDTFSRERGNINDQSDTAGKTTTENLRIALRRYRSFFQRLLSL
jgi:hypothetical protein